MKKIFNVREGCIGWGPSLEFAEGTSKMLLASLLVILIVSAETNKLYPGVIHSQTTICRSHYVEVANFLLSLSCKLFAASECQCNFILQQVPTIRQLHHQGRYLRSLRPPCDAYL